MKLFNFSVFWVWSVLTLSFFCKQITSHQILTSPIVTNWGTWGDMENCPPGSKVISAQVKTEPWDFWDIVVDDTCLNAIKFMCGDPVTGEVTSIITSKEGEWGKWGEVLSCEGNGYVVGFTLRSEPENADSDIDETATNNIRLHCRGSTSSSIEMDGETWGEWTNPRICDATEYVCGLQTQVQDPQGSLSDDTALNNIRVECCDLP